MFPRENSLGDPVVWMEAGCVSFNNNQNMDWNRWIRKGINYIKISDMDKCLNSDKVKTFIEIY